MSLKEKTNKSIILKKDKFIRWQVSPSCLSFLPSIHGKTVNAEIAKMTETEDIRERISGGGKRKGLTWYRAVPIGFARLPWLSAAKRSVVAKAGKGRGECMLSTRKEIDVGSPAEVSAKGFYTAFRSPHWSTLPTDISLRIPRILPKEGIFTIHVVPVRPSCVNSPRKKKSSPSELSCLVYFLRFPRSLSKGAT